MDGYTRDSLRSELEDVLEKWTEDVSAGEIWIKGYVGKRTIRLMSKAAIGVLDAVDDVQEYIKSEGMLKD